MAWGIFNKIKKGFKKVFKFIKNKVIKPLLKHAPEIMSQYGPMLATMPGKAGLVGKVMVGAAPLVESWTEKYRRTK